MKLTVPTNEMLVDNPSMKNRLLFALIFGLISLSLSAQVQQKDKDVFFGQEDEQKKEQSFFFSGNVFSEETQEALENVQLYFPKIEKGTLTDARGNFQIELPYGEHTFLVESLGYKSQQKRLEIYQNGTLAIYLQTEVETLSEVVLVSAENNLLESEMTGKAQLMADESKTIPLVLGESNLLKAATILPGISTAGEAATGFNVRGGKADQNLILLNEAVVINPNHFFGIFQALNPFVLKGINIYKGNIPIEYEGRTSSVFEITTKKANTQKTQGEVSIGPITANAMVEVPLVKGRSGMMIGGRSAHSDWLLKSLKDPQLKKSSASFYDLIAIYNDQLNEKNQLQATVYASHDRFSITSDSLYQYSNRLASLQWKRQLSAKTHMKWVASHSDYGFSIRYDGGVNNNFLSQFALTVRSLRSKWVTDINARHQLIYGANFTQYLIRPGEISPLTSSDLIRPERLAQENGLEGSFFVADRIRLSDRILINLGFQLAAYAAMGPATLRLYEPNLPKSELSVTGQNTYSNGQIFGQQLYPNFRFSGRYKLTDNLTLKLAALQIYQFVHSLTNNTTASPIDTWRISSPHLLPQKSNQIAAGFFASSPSGKFTFSLEGFYKRQENLVDFKTGAQLFLNRFIETEVLQGKGKSYGVEVLLQKKIGQNTGWLSYTYARSLIQLASPFSVEQVNNGNFFPTNYDKPHDFALTWNYALGERLSFSTNALYQTGRPVTLPSGNFQFNQAEYVLYSNRNAYRIPDYYRIDIGLNYKQLSKTTRKLNWAWTLSVYNLMGRNNPFSVFFVSEDGSIKGRQSTIFNVPIPSLSINIRFQ